MLHIQYRSNNQRSTRFVTLLHTKRKYLTLIVLILSSIFNSSIVQAQTPTDESLNKLMQVTPIDEMLVDDIMRQAYAQNVMLIPQIAQDAVRKENTTLTDQQKQQLDQIVKDYAGYLLNDIDKNTRESVVNHYIKSAKQTYTQEEVDAQIAFYGSDVGKRIFEKQPQLMKSYMEMIIPPMTEQIKKTMDEIVPKLQADVKQVLNN